MTFMVGGTIRDRSSTINTTAISTDILKWDGLSGTIQIENTGDVAAILPVFRSSDDAFYVYPDNEAQILLPCERQRVNLMLKPRIEDANRIPVRLRLDALNAAFREIAL